MSIYISLCKISLGLNYIVMIQSSFFRSIGAKLLQVVCGGIGLHLEAVYCGIS